MFIKRAKVDKLMQDMIYWRDVAHDNYTLAKEIQAAYVNKAKSTGDSVVNAEARSANDPRFVDAVNSNQMYDRFATRDAAILTALASMATAGLLEIRPE